MFRIQKSLPDLALAGYLLASPFYVLRSGLPQPADILLLTGATILLATASFPLRFVRDPAVAGIALLVFWMVLVNATWAFWLGDASILIYSAYYLFNFLVFASFVSCFRRWTWEYTISVISASIVIQFLLFPFWSFRGFRAEVFFNNPNQVGQFSVLAFCLIFLAWLQSGQSTRINWIAVIGALGAGGLALASQSKAAVLSLAFLGLFAGMKYARKTLLSVVLSACVVLGLFSHLSTGFSISDIVIVERLGGFFAGEEQDSGLAERGYLRILEHPLHAILGAGEGAYGRWPSSGPLEIEIHSTPGTLLFSYGLPAIALALLIGLTLVRSFGMPTVLVLGAVVLYGLTHQGLRFSLAWVLLAALVVQDRLLLGRQSSA
ncbi:MAG: hypothetical protein ACI9BV_003340 [Rhodothermales bacterium]|jgi:hypothetical protein